MIQTKQNGKYHTVHSVFVVVDGKWHRCRNVFVKANGAWKLVGSYNVIQFPTPQQDVEVHDVRSCAA